MERYGSAVTRPLRLEALDRAVDRDVRYPQAAGQIGHPRLAGRGDELGDHLHVVLGGFLGVFLPGALETDLVRGGTGFG